MGKKSREDYMYEARNFRSQNLEYEKRFNRVCKLIKDLYKSTEPHPIAINKIIFDKILDILEGRK